MTQSNAKYFTKIIFLVRDQEIKITTHQNPSSDEPPHVLHLLSNVTLFGVLDGPVREEQQNVADDRQKGQRVQGDGHEKGAFSSTHVVTMTLIN